MLQNRPVILPIDRWIPQILESLVHHSSLVLQASPGSGKTTRVPPAVLKIVTGDVLVLEPRRVAAKYAARRVSDEMGTIVGKLVGYRFRFENLTSKETRLCFLTEGMLMRRLLTDPLLEGVAAVILDEFHERHLHGDIALSYLKRLQSRRSDLKIIVMSATLDAEPISKFLGGCPTFSIDAPIHPVELEYLKGPLSKHLEVAIKELTLRAIQENPSGHILIFLPGMGEIRRCSDALSEICENKNFILATLHGDLSKEEQELAIDPSQQRKIILSTNLAETSLTIDGVSVVIDSGLHRQASYSWWSGVPTLKTRPISRASAIQRAGRAGRTGPGKCYRVYTRGDFDGRAPFDTPEIRRADLTQTALELKSLEIEDLTAFPWFEAPSSQSLSSCEILLEQLGAVSGSHVGKSKLTSIGQKMVRIPAHPRIARMLIEAEANGAALEEVALLAALISEGELGSNNQIDAIHNLELIQNSHAKNAFKKVTQIFLGALTTSNRVIPVKNRSMLLRLAVLSGFPDRVARKKKALTDKLATEVELVFATGNSLKTPNTGILAESEYFAVLDIQERQGLGQAKSHLQVRSLVAIEPEWLFDLPQVLLKETDEVTWDSQRKRISVLSQMKYGDIILSEAPLTISNSGSSQQLVQIASVLLKEGVGIQLAQPATLESRIESLTPLTDSKVFEATWVRLQLFAQKTIDVTLLDSFILEVTASLIAEEKFSLSDLQDLNWTSELIRYLDAKLDLGAAGRLDQVVPTHFEMPNKRRALIQYKLNVNPWIESRLQDFFGVKQPPTVGQGKIPLTLHLLAPNYRALQVTTDLPGFWIRTYPEVRKELSRRYPRHSWPENPLIAEPVEPKKGRPEKAK